MGIQLQLQITAERLGSWLQLHYLCFVINYVINYFSNQLLHNTDCNLKNHM